MKLGTRPALQSFSCHMGVFANKKNGTKKECNAFNISLFRMCLIR